VTNDDLLCLEKECSSPLVSGEVYRVQGLKAKAAKFSLYIRAAICCGKYNSNHTGQFFTLLLNVKNEYFITEKKYFSIQFIK